MTTRAGFTGILTGLAITLIIYLLFICQPQAFLAGRLPGSALFPWVAIILVVFLMLAGGWWAGRRSGSAQPGRRVVLGVLAGSLAGVILFCLWGSATAGSARWIFPVDLTSVSRVEYIDTIIHQTTGLFLTLFLGGCVIGALGGLLANIDQQQHKDVFDKAAPQMAMNATITAVPASIVATALASYVFSRLSVLLGDQIGQTIPGGSIFTPPLGVSLLLVVVSHLSLTLVIPHEARQAEHRCGLDEVKMAAYVGIGAAPLLILFLSLANPEALTSPLVQVALLVTSIMSLRSLYHLHKLILPRRASFQAPQEENKKTEAKLFGTIAASRGLRLVVLCIGCGLVMVLPLYVSVISVLINLNHAVLNTPFPQPFTGVPWSLYKTQALTSSIVVAASITLLVVIYLFYLNLGRWFNKRNANQS